MTTYSLFFVAAILLVGIGWHYRKSISAYFGREIEINRDLNEYDEEKEYLRQLYSSLDSEELIRMKESGHLPPKEVDAIERVLQERQMMPPPF